MLFEKTILKIYGAMMGTRQDPRGDVFYFEHTDFEGMCAEPFEFLGAQGQRLVGSIYYYGEKCKEKITVFDHGMGSGHVAYMREIEKLTRHGCTVIAYDHTGCRNSEGESVRGFAQSLSDLDHCIKYVKTRADFRDADISVVGHSWGAFSTMNISALHPEITHVVAMSGFVSVDRILSQFFAGPLKGYIPAIRKLEEAANPDYVNYDAIKTLKSASTRALLIYSSDDKTVKQAMNYDHLFNELKGKENVKFILTSGKGHNPNYTKSAVRLLGAFQKKLAKFRKRHKSPTDAEKAAFIAQFDWWAMTEQDQALWDKIFDFLDN